MQKRQDGVEQVRSLRRPRRLLHRLQGYVEQRDEDSVSQKQRLLINDIDSVKKYASESRSGPLNQECSFIRGT